MYYANRTGYILVRDDGAHVRHGEVRVSEHAAKMALANYMNRAVCDVLINKGYHEDIAQVIEYVWDEVRQGATLDEANNDWARWNVCDKKYTVQKEDLDMVAGALQKERARWGIVPVTVA